jgi:hypothetical protein
VDVMSMVKALKQLDKLTNHKADIELVMGDGVILFLKEQSSYLGQGMVVELSKKENLILLKRGEAGEIEYKDKQLGKKYVAANHLGEFIMADHPIDLVSVDEATPEGRRNGLEYNVRKWLETGRRGASSNTMAAYLTGLIPLEEINHPYDPSDFKRCQLLLEAAPELREILPKMKKASNEWSALIDNWSNLETLYKEESTKESAPKLYAEMQRILLEVRANKEKTKNGLEL